MQYVKRQQLLTRTKWRREGRGLRSKQLPCDSFTANGNEIGLYSKNQTTAFTPYKRALTYLVDLFGNYPTELGYTTVKGKIGRIAGENLRG